MQYNFLWSLLSCLRQWQRLVLDFMLEIFYGRQSRYLIDVYTLT